MGAADDSNPIIRKLNEEISVRVSVYNLLTLPKEAVKQAIRDDQQLREDVRAKLIPMLDASIAEDERRDAIMAATIKFAKADVDCFNAECCGDYAARNAIMIREIRDEIRRLLDLGRMRS